MTPPPVTLPPCPHLPEATSPMDYRALRRFGADRGAGFYEAALTYGQYLWQRGLSARAILCLDRALFAELRGEEAVLKQWPLPYRALRWMLEAERGEEAFLGNPRVSYQHLAGRVRGERAAVKRWRAWACWHVTRAALPALPGDPRHAVTEPSEEEVAAGLAAYGIPGEADMWAAALRA